MYFQIEWKNTEPNADLVEAANGLNSDFQGKNHIKKMDWILTLLHYTEDELPHKLMSVGHGQKVLLFLK